jgi:uncharacterized membrane protein
MKAKLTLLRWPGIFLLALVALSSFKGETADSDRGNPQKLVAAEKLKEEAFDILDTKCNVCHRKRNPFMVFNEKNMSRRAERIYRMVFVERRMPKGDEVQLTDIEYNKLKKWLLTENIL